MHPTNPLLPRTLSLPSPGCNLKPTCELVGSVFRCGGEISDHDLLGELSEIYGVGIATSTSVVCTYIVVEWTEQTVWRLIPFTL